MVTSDRTSIHLGKIDELWPIGVAGYAHIFNNRQDNHARDHRRLGSLCAGGFAPRARTSNDDAIWRAIGPYTAGDVCRSASAVLARHGTQHSYLPSEVNYRANIFALKKLGARRVVGISAAGSLRMEIKPGELALAAQYFDHTRGKRAYSFFGNGVVAHVSTANPACPSLSADIARAAGRGGESMHEGKTYGCVEGPRLGTRAESFFLRDAAQCDLVGMTNVPSIFGA